MEWGIRYEDKNAVQMSGEPVYVYITVQSKAVAEAASQFEHGPWADRDVVVVKREVTDWTQA